MLFLYQRDCVITSNYAKRGIYHLSDAKMKEPQMPDFNRGCQVYKLAFNPFLLKKARASLRPMTRSF